MVKHGLSAHWGNAALEGSWRAAFPPEISTGEAVVAGPSPSVLQPANRVHSSFSAGRG